MAVSAAALTLSGAVGPSSLRPVPRWATPGIDHKEQYAANLDRLLGGQRPVGRFGRQPCDGKARKAVIIYEPPIEPLDVWNRTIAIPCEGAGNLFEQRRRRRMVASCGSRSGNFCPASIGVGGEHDRRKNNRHGGRSRNGVGDGIRTQIAADGLERRLVEYKRR